MPMSALQHQWELIPGMLEDGRINGYEIIATVLLDGHQEQATWIRDFIASH